MSLEYLGYLWPYTDIRAMAATGVDCGVFTETKITDDIYMGFSSGYNVLPQTPSASGREGLPSSGGTMISTRLRSLKFTV